MSLGQPLTTSYGTRQVLAPDGARHGRESRRLCRGLRCGAASLALGPDPEAGANSERDEYHSNGTHRSLSCSSCDGRVSGLDATANAAPLYIISSAECAWTVVVGVWRGDSRATGARREELTRYLADAMSPSCTVLDSFPIHHSHMVKKRRNTRRHERYGSTRGAAEGDGPGEGDMKTLIVGDDVASRFLGCVSPPHRPPGRDGWCR